MRFRGRLAIILSVPAFFLLMWLYLRFYPPCMSVAMRDCERLSTFMNGEFTVVSVRLEANDGTHAEFRADYAVVYRGRMEVRPMYIRMQRDGFFWYKVEMNPDI